MVMSACLAMVMPVPAMRVSKLALFAEAEPFFER
jgi:hypothetical protein